MQGVTTLVASNEDIALVVERQAAARRLLADPIMTMSTHPEDFAVVRAHSDWLIQRFHRVLGYELTITAGHARLAKAGPVHAVARPPARASGAPFTPRTYSYLALCLAALVESPSTISLSRLADEVRAAAVEAGLDLNPRESMSERRAFIAALRHLAAWGAVTEREGALSAHAIDATGEVGLAVDHGVARSAVAHPPHAAPDPASYLDAMDRADPAGDAAAELALRRLLAETAVVYRGDLSERQRARLTQHQWRAVAELGELLGCDAEIRAEGVALIMPDDIGTEHAVLFPSSDPVGQGALVLVERLLARLRPENGPAQAVAVPANVLRSELADVTDPGTEPARRWARTALRHIPDPQDLTDRILRLLSAAGLMARDTTDPSPHEGWSVLPAAARYGGKPRAGPGRRTGDQAENV